jgi:XRE family transcriptional regulator, aerobic/anaerobic benzoate catabolism transcriptional regulator
MNYSSSVAPQRDPLPSAADAREPVLVRLGAQVRARRRQLALTLRELALAAGVSERFLVSVENGRGNVSVVRLDHIARALGTSAAALLEDDDPVAVAPSSGPVVALLGLRGAGKSTVGARAAARLGVPFVELDARIVERAGMSLEAIFSLHGADYYRRLEQREVEGLARDRGIAATGGGIVTNHATFERLRRDAVTVWLSATAEDHFNRVVAQGDVRPMANRSDAMAELRAILRARRALYERAHHVVDTSALGLDRSVDAVVRIARQARE